MNKEDFIYAEDTELGLKQFSRLLDRLIENNEKLFHNKNTRLSKDNYIYFMEKLRQEFKNLNLYRGK